MKINHLILTFCVMEMISHGTTTSKKREKRYLLFTRATQWGVFVTISVPLPHPEETVSVAWFFEANYYSVDNSTYFEPLLGDIVTSRRHERGTNQNSISRHQIYQLIETMLEKHDYPGRLCLLRAICDSSSSNFSEDGVQGDLVHFILTPSTSRSEEELDDCYYEAEFWGLEQKCDRYISSCPNSPMDLFSVLIKK